MMIPFGDLSRQYRSMRPAMDRAWKRVTASGWFILGKEVEAFEREFARYVGTAEAVGVGNGMEALQLALVAGGVGPGDEVITSPVTAVPTVNAISAAGAKPVFADIDPTTYTLDPASVEQRITRKTKALLPVHLYGHPADLEPLRRIARVRRMLFIEDAAQAHGALYQGRKVGTFGQMGCFSFYPSKNLGAYGDGGMVVTNNGKLAARLRSLRNYGQSKRYYHEIPGFNSRLDELQAAILREKLKKLDAWNQRRRDLAAIYDRLLGDLSLTLPMEGPEARHIYHLYVVRTPKRDALMVWLKRQGIQTLVHYPVPVHLQKAYRSLGYKKGSFPRAEAASREILSLPLFPELKEAEVERVAKAIRGFFQNGTRRSRG